MRCVQIPGSGSRRILTDMRLNRLDFCVFDDVRSALDIMFCMQPSLFAVVAVVSVFSLSCCSEGIWSAWNVV